MSTFCEAKLEFMDTTARIDSSVLSSENKEIGNIELLKEDVEIWTYGTLELNQFILDETRSIMPMNPEDIAFLSKETSNAEGVLEVPPKVIITFAEQHSSAGLTLTFPEIPEQILISWYTLSGEKIDSAAFYPDSQTYICRKQVENYGRIEIRFEKTKFPYQYATLQYIEYGYNITWNTTDISSAKILEQVDPTGATLAINTAEIEIVDTNNDFDISNTSNTEGAWKVVQEEQEVCITEYLGNAEVPMGTFFISGFSFKDNKASFSLMDNIGRMDKYTFYNGNIYEDIPAGDILESIFSVCGINKYKIDEEVAQITLTGYLAIQTCREALQMVCFACGAIADDSRSDTVKIYIQDRFVRSTIGTERKFFGETTIELDEYVSGVSIENNRYTLDSNESEIYNGEMEAGDTKILFSSPYLTSSISCSAGSIKEIMTNYIIVHLDEPETVVIKGRKYSSDSFVYQKSVSVLEAGTRENIKEFGTCTLYNATRLAENAESLLKYYSLRKKVKLKYLLQSEQVGQWVDIRDIKLRMSTTEIESQSIDLTGGFIAEAECRGYSSVVTENYFAGTELYAGGSGII